MTTEATTARLLTSRADVTTDAPGRYAKQLLSHLGRKVEFVEEPTGTWTAHIIGSVARIIVSDNALVLQAEGPDEQSVARIEHALGNHLERFGQRKQLAVTWQRTTSAA
jgi:hypothetical protein